MYPGMGQDIQSPPVGTLIPLDPREWEGFDVDSWPYETPTFRVETSAPYYPEIPWYVWLILGIVVYKALERNDRH